MHLSIECVEQDKGANARKTQPSLGEQLHLARMELRKPGGAGNVGQHVARRMTTPPISYMLLKRERRMTTAPQDTLHRSRCAWIWRTRHNLHY